MNFRLRTWLGWGLIAMFILELGFALKPPKDKTFAISQFARLPLLFNGRVQPMDSLARNSLLQIRNTLSVPLEGNDDSGKWGEWSTLTGALHERHWYQFLKHPKKLKPSEWLLEVMSAPERADDRYVFAASHPELLGLLKLDGKGVENSGLHYFRFNDLAPVAATLQTEAQRAGKLDASQRSSFDRSVLQLQNALVLYLRLKNAIEPSNSSGFVKELADYSESIGPGRAAVMAQQAGKTYDKAAFDRLMRHLERFDTMSHLDPPLVVPPPHPGEDRNAWMRTGEALMEMARGGPMPDAVRFYAAAATAFRNGDATGFNSAITGYESYLKANGFQRELTKGAREFFFNRLMAFKRCLYIYLTAFLLVLAYWFNFTPAWRVTALRLTIIAFVVHTAGLIFRMVLEGRPAGHQSLLLRDFHRLGRRACSASCSSDFTATESARGCHPPSASSRSSSRTTFRSAAIRWK